MTNPWFPTIQSIDDAKKLTRQGAFGVLLFAAMNLLGLFLAYYARQSPVDGHALDAQSIQDQVIGAFIVMPPLLFFAWRVYKGKGWLAAGLVLTWFVVEVSLKIAGGSTNVGWIIFYLAVAAMIFNGMRGCWWLRKSAPSSLSDT